MNRNTSSELTPPTGKVACTRCGGWGFYDIDEDGREYTCYHCDSTGWLSKEAADEEERDAEQEAEREAANTTGMPAGWTPLNRQHLQGA